MQNAGTLLTGGPGVCVICGFQPPKPVVLGTAEERSSVPEPVEGRTGAPVSTKHGTAGHFDKLSDRSGVSQNGGGSVFGVK